MPLPHPMLENALNQVKKDVHFFTAKKTWSKIAPAQLIGIFIVGLSVVGVAASMFLVQTNNDIRQQAQVAYTMCITSSDSSCIGRQYDDGCLTPGGKPGLCSPETGNPTSCTCKQLATATPTRNPGLCSFGDYQCVVKLDGTNMEQRCNQFGSWEDASPCSSGRFCVQGSARCVTVLPTNTPTRTSTPKPSPLPTAGQVATCIARCSYESNADPAGNYAFTCLQTVRGIEEYRHWCGTGVMCNGSSCASAATNTPTRTPTRTPVPIATSTPVSGCTTISGIFVAPSRCFGESRCVSNSSGGYTMISDTSCSLATSTPTPTQKVALAPKVSTSLSDGKVAVTFLSPTPSSGCDYNGVHYSLLQCISGESKRCTSLGVRSVTEGVCVVESTPVVTSRATRIPTPTVDPNKCYYGDPNNGQPGWVEGTCLAGRECVRESDGNLGWSENDCTSRSEIGSKIPAVTPTTTPKTILVDKGGEQKVVQVNDNPVCTATADLGKLPLIGGVWVNVCTTDVVDETLNTQDGSVDQKVTPETKPDNGPLCFDLPLLGLTGICNGTKPEATIDVKPTPVQNNSVNAISPTPVLPDTLYYVSDANTCTSITQCESSDPSDRVCQARRSQYAEVRAGEYYLTRQECEDSLAPDARDGRDGRDGRDTSDR